MDTVETISTRWAEIIKIILILMVVTLPLSLSGITGLLFWPIIAGFIASIRVYKKIQDTKSGKAMYALMVFLLTFALIFGEFMLLLKMIFSNSSSL